MTKVPIESIVINAGTLNLLSAQWTEVLRALKYGASYFEVYNGSTTPISVGVGAIGKEEALPYTIVGGGTNGMIAQSIPAGSRVSLKPVDSNITDGFIILNLFTGTP